MSKVSKCLRLVSRSRGTRGVEGATQRQAESEPEGRF